MKMFLSTVVATVLMLAAGVSSAQSGNMMGGDMGSAGWMGGYGGIWTPILLVIVIAGAVAWFVKQKGK